MKEERKDENISFGSWEANLHNEQTFDNVMILRSKVYWKMQLFRDAVSCLEAKRHKRRNAREETNERRKLKFQKTLRRQAKNLYAEILPRDDPYWYWSPFCFHNVWKLSKKSHFSNLRAKRANFTFWFLSSFRSMFLFLVFEFSRQNVVKWYILEFFSNTVIEYTIICRSEEESSPKSFLPLPSQSP